MSPDNRLLTVLQIEHMLSSPLGASKAAAVPGASTNDMGLAGLEHQKRHAWEDEVLIAQLASSETPKHSVRAWQGDLCRLGAELAKVCSFLPGVTHPFSIGSNTVWLCDAPCKSSLCCRRVRSEGNAAWIRYVFSSTVEQPLVMQVDIALCDLVLKLLCWDPAKRLSTIDALLHPFFDVFSPLRHLLQVQPSPNFSLPCHSAAAFLYVPLSVDSH